MKTICGNILSVEIGIIGHQVNCQKIAGSGLALQIRRKYPGWYKDFISANNHLSDIHLYEVTDKLAIANLYGQDKIGKGLQTNYNALFKCLDSLAWISEANPELPVYLPYGIGCGLGGGNWLTVERIIQSTIPNAILYKKD